MVSYLQTGCSYGAYRQYVFFKPKCYNNSELNDIGIQGFFCTIASYPATNRLLPRNLSAIRFSKN
ncbi:hypothetical protein KsCSTR_30260 [Candidatus Kuenenia stuttgartiensis]|uniref:Uncharacterized protein n=1 Tax=Kuenenia stuttgartiensis TaxID=174633 RepID=Q1Q5I3_KUEST|nr:hypothetical protein KsCSTR_30260 [Candidatus Kuenenia stuttgartiensis]CAJ75275.1 unknown protein [Candidatus Kuenenia stuttgartiensis]